jgi:hypothetical protein
MKSDLLFLIPLLFTSTLRERNEREKPIFIPFFFFVRQFPQSPQRHSESMSTERRLETHHSLLHTTVHILVSVFVFLFDFCMARMERREQTVSGLAGDQVLPGVNGLGVGNWTSFQEGSTTRHTTSTHKTGNWGGLAFQRVLTLSLLLCTCMHTMFRLDSIRAR